MSNLNNAAREYLNRRDRITHPAGSFDKAKRFTLSDDEICECCKDIRAPSRAYPFPEMVHARTAKHVASLFNVDVTEMKRAAKKLAGK